MKNAECPDRCLDVSPGAAWWCPARLPVCIEMSATGSWNVKKWMQKATIWNGAIISSIDLTDIFASICSFWRYLHVWIKWDFEFEKRTVMTHFWTQPFEPSGHFQCKADPWTPVLSVPFFESQNCEDWFSSGLKMPPPNLPWVISLFKFVPFELQLTDFQIHRLCNPQNPNFKPKQKQLKMQLS